MDHVLAVGRATPAGDMAVVILQSDEDDLFYVCAHKRGVFESLPYPLTLNEQWRVVDFDEGTLGSN